MRLLVVVAQSSGGMAAHVRHACDLMSRAGHQVVLAAPLALSPDNASWRHVPLAVASPSVSGIIDAAKLAHFAREADVVHAHGVRASALLTLLGIRHVATWHSLAGGDRPGAVARAMEYASARGADEILAVSSPLMKRARERGATQVRRALVPPPGLTRRRAGDPLRPPHDPVAITTVARLAPQKGLDLLLDAAEILSRQREGVRWNVIGDGPERRACEERVRARGLPVVFEGYSTCVGERLADSDIYVQTSRSEGQPVAVQEALWAACALVATDVGGTAEVTGDAALLVPPSADAIARALSRYLDDPALLERARRSSYERAQRLPREEDVAAQLEDTYRRHRRA
ncbi:MAG: glycosyltransferase family 4 protein [Actinomycetaceae bacterium]|nr:glycosyltransferase family 4 protein [Actinomycetaceae bacterium]